MVNSKMVVGVVAIVDNLVEIVMVEITYRKGISNGGKISKGQMDVTYLYFIYQMNGLLKTFISISHNLVI